MTGTGTAAVARLRTTALRTWLGDPSRLRQDANLEDDHARDHDDRVVVELAQNAADAARLAATEGHLLLRLTGDDELVVANTGRGLDGAGLESLCALRASAKTEGVGRFGVGFAAVRALSDDITIVTRTSSGPFGARFDLRSARRALGAAAAGDAALARVLTERGDDLPVLRLPFALPDDAEDLVPSGYDTAVVLRLRGTAALRAAREALADVDDPLLLALPDLARVRIELPGEPARTVADVTERWITRRAEGRLAPGLLADRPVEEQARPAWQVTWALPRALLEDGLPPGEAWPAAGVLHAPTPTHERLSMPALLIASFPLDATRREVPAGPLRDHLSQQAADLYAELAQHLAAGEAGTGGRRPGAHVLRLLPEGLPASELDADLRDRVTAAMSHTPLLPTPGGDLLAPRRAQAIDGPLGQDDTVLTALEPFVGDLVRVPPALRSRVRRLDLLLRAPEDVIAELPGARCTTATLHPLYDAFAPHVGECREALATLPVLLADGRLVRGARGVVLADAGDWRHLPSGLPVADQAHPLLERLGAQQLDAAGLLRHEAVRDRLRGEPDAHDAVLDLVGRALDQGAAELPGWLGDLRLPDGSGAVHPARDLVLPGSRAARVLRGARAADDALLARWGPAVLRAVGVREELVASRRDDVVADPALAGSGTDLSGWADYLAEIAAVLGPGAYVGEVLVVTGLADVAEDAWPEVLAHLAVEPGLRAALLEPAADGVTSYTAWWLRAELGAPLAEPGTGLPFLPEAPAWLAALDDEVRAALGVVADLGDLDGAGWDVYVDDWPPEGEITADEAVGLWRAIACAAERGTPLPAPATVPALHAGRTVMTDAADVVVAGPGWAQVRLVLPVPAHLTAEVADALDLDEPGHEAPHAAGAERAATPAEVRAVVAEVPTHYWECEHLEVAGTAVDWWAVEAAAGAPGEAWTTTTDGLAHALAAAGGRWELRHLIARLLSAPELATELLLETAGDAPVAR